MEIEETLLPGIGVRYDMVTVAGKRFSVLVHRDGTADIATFAEDDPDEAEISMTLQEDEVAALAELLGAPRVTKRIADLSREIPGLKSARLEVSHGSAFDGRVLGDTHARTLTGCSVVAVVRGSDVITTPGPETRLSGGDLLVAIGDAESLARLAELLAKPLT